MYSAHKKNKLITQKNATLVTMESQTISIHVYKRVMENTVNIVTKRSRKELHN